MSKMRWPQRLKQPWIFRAMVSSSSSLIPSNKKWKRDTFQTIQRGIYRTSNRLFIGLPLCMRHAFLPIFSFSLALVLQVVIQIG
ncbi:hypothetical protein PAXRUDRAFT_614156 [Paxillus rubicundulus Ve08.2h10]|uniref:Uncharacterized protein n=1 Tax=Paxillus rubicundulus Ve08.2h10 TaxID=930991 RepID=A0A0D0EC90_9AGAM|nr:hypothetical protein PAXRUDRAFT_614156 [Paxillus rubicundulus Ve08.2h10]